LANLDLGPKPNGGDQLLPTTGYSDPFQPTDWTFSATPFFRPKLDWIAVKDAGVMNCGIGPFGSSDNRPLWAEIDIGDCWEQK